MGYSSNTRVGLWLRTSVANRRAATASINVTKTNSLLLLACLFLCEVSVAAMSVGIYVKGDRTVPVFLSSISGKVFLLATAAFVVTGAVIFHQYLASIRLRSRHFRLVVMMNLTMVILVVTVVEIVVRAGTSSSPSEGDIWRWRVLVPKSWSNVALYERQLIDQRSGRLSYLIYDDLMGWTIGPNRRSANGLYRSSSEGIRAAHEGVSFAKSTGKTRIALVGDSFTFGEDVAYEDSWGFLLEKALGPKFEVLNFGVGGYGADQAYLRYEKDVRQWKPSIVIFGLISDDVERTMRLYPTLSSWVAFPFSKPRFVLRDGNLKKLNVPPLAPQNLFTLTSISDLPFLEYDRGYRPSQWQANLIHHSYLARAVMTLFPPWEGAGRDNSDSALMSVNVSIVKAFSQSAASDKAIPLVVYFPQENAEFNGLAGPVPVGKQVLQEAGIIYTDLTPCLMPIKPTERFPSVGSHYSATGNARIAQCLVPIVAEALAAPRT